MGEARATALVLTVSDGVSAGTREDLSGARLASRLEAAGYAVSRAVVPDEPNAHRGGRAREPPPPTP